MPNYRTLLFDLDNTLIDFSFSEEKALSETYKSFFADSLSNDDFLSQFNKINSQLWRQVESGEITAGDAGGMRFKQLVNNIGVDLNADMITHSYEQALANHTDWYPGVEAKLDELKQNYQLGIITNGLTMVQELKYQRLNMQKWFSCYIISEKIGIAKPNPVIFDNALTQLDADRSTTLMIGDSLTSDYQGAINSNLDFCWINSQGLALPSETSRPKFVMRSIVEFDVAQEVL